MKPSIIDELTIDDVVFIIGKKQIQLEKQLKLIKICFFLYFGTKVIKYIKHVNNESKKQSIKETE